MDRTTLLALGDELEKIASGSTLTNPKVILPAAGALLAVGAQALANYAPKGGKSVQQKFMDKKMLAQRYDQAQRRREGRKPSFAEETGEITTDAMHRMSNVAAKHPIKAALPAATLGAAAGAAIARALK